MKIEKITENKKQFIDLLLLADEQEDMIDKYLPNGDMFALYNHDLKSVCVVAKVNNYTCELKNIATYPEYQGNGYGKALIKYISGYYKNKYKTIVLGMFLKGLFQSLWGLLFIIPGIIKGYEYRMIPYLLAENPEMSYKEAFEASKIMMDGEKWNAFVLDLSFIGWGILSFFTCFLLSIFYVSPYQYLTNAQLYIVLRKKLEANGGTARYGLVEYSEEPAPETYNYDHNF